MKMIEIIKCLFGFHTYVKISSIQIDGESRIDLSCRKCGKNKIIRTW